MKGGYVKMEQTGEISQTGKKVEQQSDLDSLKPIETTSIDLSKYDKKEVSIAKVTKVNMPSKFHDCGKADVLKVESEILETVDRMDENGNSDPINFRASELFSLTNNDKGEAIGWSTSMESNLMKFAKDVGIKKPDEFDSLPQLISELIGKKVLLKSYTREKDGRTQTYLKFRY